MIKVFSGQWRGLGETDDKALGMLLDFKFREIIHEFGGAKLAVFLSIALHTDQNGLAWPSYATLERETGYSRDTIARALNDLCKLVISGQRVLMRYRERAGNGQFTGSNRYLIFPTTAEVCLFEAEPESENLTSPESENLTTQSENLTSGVVRKSDSKLNHDSLSESIKEHGSQEQAAWRSQKKGDLVDGILAYQRKPGDIELADWPEDVRPVIRKYCQLWGQTPPAKVRKGGDYAAWIKEARYIAEAGGAIVLQVLESLKDQPYDWMRTAMIARPGALIKAVRARAGELRSQPQADDKTDLAAMRERIRATKAAADVAA